MAASWVKSLQCKSRALDDVYHPIPKPLLPSAICKNTAQNLKDVIDNSKPKPKLKPKPKPKPKPDLNRTHKRTLSSLPRRTDSIKPKPDPISSTSNSHIRRTLSAPINKTRPDSFPAVSELQVGHASRNVVEIIFHSRWSPKGFPGRVDMVFKIQNIPRILSQFEEYRDFVRTRAGSGSARCSADGNEMMRFRCLGPTAYGGVVLGGDCGGILSIGGGKGSICTYCGSGAAHESAGGGRGRRAMLVCRVIAGRVTKRVGLDELLDGPGDMGSDSVGGDNGELLVFDNRAVLPCFLVIYKL